MDKQQGATVQLRVLYSIACDKPSWKTLRKENIHMYTCINESLCDTPERNNTANQLHCLKKGTFMLCIFDHSLKKVKYP